MTKFWGTVFVFLLSSWNLAYAEEIVQFNPEFGISVPYPLQVGASLKCEEVWFFCHKNITPYALGGYFYLPFGESKSLSIVGLEGGVRYFPWTKGFFLSLGLGYRHVSLRGDLSAFKIDDEVIVTSASINLSTFYLNPSIGWSWELSSKLLLGFDIGIQLPVLATGEMYLEDSNTGENSNNSSTLKINSDKAMGRIAGLPLPKITLIRFTWLFN